MTVVRKWTKLEDVFPIEQLGFSIASYVSLPLEVNHHFKNDGSFWNMINPY